MMIEEIRENMKKELDQQKAKVQQAAQQRAMIAQQGEMLEKQQAENKLVLMELGNYSRHLYNCSKHCNYFYFQMLLKKMQSVIK